MRWFHKAIIIGIIITILTVVLVKLNVNSEYIFIASSLATLILGGLSLFFKEEKEKIMKLLFKLHDEYQKEEMKRPMILILLL